LDQHHVVSCNLGDFDTSALEALANRKLGPLNGQGLSKEEEGWKLSFDLGALQPQRIRLIKPVLFVIPKESTTLDFAAKLFANGFANPLALDAKLEIEVSPMRVTATELVPDIKERWQRGRKSHPWRPPTMYRRCLTPSRKPRRAMSRCPRLASDSD
jgi:hypothetical protein